MPVLFGGHNLPLLVEIGLTDLPKSGGAMAPQAPPGRHPCLSMILYPDSIKPEVRNFVIEGFLGHSFYYKIP